MKKFTLFLFMVMVSGLAFAQPATFIDLGVVGPADTYTFDSNNSVFTAPGTGNVDTEIGLWDAAGTLLDADDDGGIGLWSLVTASLADGDYYIGISEFNSVFGNGFVNTGTGFESGEVANLALNITWSGGTLGAVYTGASDALDQETAFFKVTISSAPQPIAACGPTGLLIPAVGSSGPMDPSPATVTETGIIGTNYFIDTVLLDLNHTFDGDLDITLTSPSGTVLMLSDQNGGAGNDYIGTIFQDGNPNINTGSAPFTGFWEPEGGTFASTFDGESITGDWTLNIFDNFGGDSGVLNNFCISFEPILGDPPIIVCPSDITANTDPGACGAIVNFGTPAAIDPDGDLDTVTQTQGPPSGSEFPVGTTLVEFTATDLAGNSASCTFNVTVIDDELPVVTCNDIVAELDENGMITVLPEDIAGVTDNCPGTTLEFLLPGGPSGSLETLFAANNGGSFGGVVYFDVTVGANSLNITAFDTNTAETGAFTIDVYTVPGTYVGNNSNPGAWTLQAVGTGTALGLNQPSNAVLDAPITLAANTSYGFAIVMDASHGHDYTNGNGSNQNFSNGDLTIDLGGGANIPFSTQLFSPRVWNGRIYYDSPGPPAPSIDFSCADVGPNSVTVLATDASGNTSTCTATVTVEDNIAPVIQCWGQPGGADYLEEFEGATVPAGWTTEVLVGNEDWAFGSGDLPIGDDFPTNAAIFDDDAAGPGNTNVVVLNSPVFDLSMATTANLSYDVAFQEFGDQEFSVEVWDGAAWQVIALYEDDLDPNIQTETFDVSAFNNADFQVRFFYDDLGGWGWHAGVDNFHLVYDVPSTPLVVQLDAAGMATLDASDLLVDIDEACGYTVTTGGGAPVPGSLQTLFASDNGGATGGAVYFDLTVGPEDINVTDIDISTGEGGAFTMDVYTAADTYVGNEGNAGAWTLQTSASGTGAGIDTPSNAVLDTPLTLEAGMSYGIALVLDASHAHDYTNGDGSNENYSNADLSLTAGAASNVPFDGAPFSPRVFNGSINYEIGSPPSEIIEFTCEDLGFNTIDITVTDASGNVSTCTSTVEVIDVTNPVLACLDATVELDENGMAEVLPEFFIDTNNSFDACGITITAVDVTDVTCADIGTPITVTVFASDASGNLASCTATLTVVDAMGPMIEGCPDDLTVDPGPNNLFYELPDYWASGDITATDNCTDPVTIFSQDPAPGTLLPDGVYNISILAEDEYGNVGACTFVLTIESVLGLDDYNLENGVVLYPNPAMHTVTIANATTIQLEQAAIYDINGRLIQTIDLTDMITEQSVDVSNLASGVYMVQIMGTEGQTVKRLVKE